MPDLIKDNQLLKEFGDSDESLMILFRQDNEDAFRILFDRYCARIINFAFRFLNSKEDAEDITQEVFVRIYRKKLIYNPKSPFRPWLYSIVSHLVSNKLRDKKRHPHHSLDWTATDEEGNEFSVEPIEMGTSSESVQSERTELTRSVQSAVQALPQNQRAAVLLAKFEGLSYEEIAAAMGLSLSSVTSLLFRARQTLKEALSEFSQKT